MGKKVIGEIIQRPTIFFEGKNTLQDVSDFKKTQKIWKELDIYELQLKEFFEI